MILVRRFLFDFSFSSQVRFFQTFQVRGQRLQCTVFFVCLFLQALTASSMYDPMSQFAIHPPASTCPAARYLSPQDPA